MALNYVELPFDYFPDFSKGRPIFGGKIYVGNVGTDPKIPANQKQVYIQEAFIGGITPIAVAQPIDISNGGVPEYSGNPVVISVDGDYSIRIDDRNGNQVYYFPSVRGGQPITPDDIDSYIDTYNESKLGGFTNYTFATLADAITATLKNGQTAAYEVGDTITTDERVLNGGGGGEYRVVLTSSVTPNDIDIIQTTADPLLSLELLPKGLVDIAVLGGVGDNLTNNNAVIERASQITKAVFLDGSKGTYNFSAPLTLAAGFTTLILGQTAITGIFAEDINGLLVNEGNLRGYPIAEELRYSGVEIIAGTLRQNGDKDCSITRSGSTATVTQTAHGYENGDLVYIRGADQTEYNVSAEVITVLDDDTYTYTVSGAPTTPASGTLKASVPARWNWIKDSNHEPLGVDDSVDAIASGATLTINFTKSYSRVLSIVSGPDETLSNALSFSVGQSVGNSLMQLKASAKVTMAGKIYYDGADWQISYGAGQGGTGAHNAYITDISASGANVTVTHEWIGGADISLTPDTNEGAVIPYIPATRSVSNTGWVMNFINYAGAFVGTPDTSMSVRFTKQFGQGIVLDGTGNFDTLNLYLGNIWFFGIMEV